MSHVTYTVVEHDGGWAYKVGDVFSETFATRELAHRAAALAALEQQTPGQGGPIEYEDRAGRWHEELAAGNDRPADRGQGLTPDAETRPGGRQRE